jgi:hypothetical protein
MCSVFLLSLLLTCLRRLLQTTSTIPAVALVSPSIPAPAPSPSNVTPLDPNTSLKHFAQLRTAASDSLDWEQTAWLLAICARPPAEALFRQPAVSELGLTGVTHSIILDQVLLRWRPPATNSKGQSVQVSSALYRGLNVGKIAPFFPSTGRKVFPDGLWHLAVSTFQFVPLLCEDKAEKELLDQDFCKLTELMQYSFDHLRAQRALTFEEQTAVSVFGVLTGGSLWQLYKMD